MKDTPVIVPLTFEEKNSFLANYPYVGQGMYDLSSDIESEFIPDVLLQKEKDRIQGIDFNHQENFAYYDILKICKFRGYTLMGYNPVKNPNMDELTQFKFVFNELQMGYPNSKTGIILFKLITGPESIQGQLIYKIVNKIQLQLL